MDNMPLENSFPQICVVSRNEFVENSRFHQEYRRIMSQSNLACLLKNQYRFEAFVLSPQRCFGQRPGAG